jgi:NDP-sugar pyrophosphorylase family protein
VSQLRKAVILCAGYGTRLMPLTADTSKVMLPVRGRPIVEHHILRLAAAGMSDLYVNLHAHAGAIQDYLGDGSRFGVRLHAAVEPSLRGTAGSLLGFRESLDETFLVQYGDVYSEIDVGMMRAFHEQNRAAATLAAHPSSHPEDSDIVEFDCRGRISALHHKPGSRVFGATGNAGCYILEPSALEFVPERGPSDFVIDVFPAMLRRGCALFAYHTTDFLFDMGTHDRYEQLRAKLEQV